jgi:hypothetical protein
VHDPAVDLLVQRLDTRTRPASRVAPGQAGRRPRVTSRRARGV